MLPLRLRLARAGRLARTVELAPLAIQDVRQLAVELDGNVERVRRETGADRVDVVGVSLGGIVALWWAHRLGGWNRIRRFVLVGSPVRGTWAAALGVPFLGLVSDGIWQLLPTADLVADLERRPLPPGAEVTTLALDRDPVCPPDRCRLPGARNVVFRGSVGPLSHQWLVFSRRLSRELLDVLG